MKTSISLKIGAGFSLGLVVLLVIGVLSFRNTSSLIRASEEVTHTHQILQELESISGLLTDAAYGQRGFIITGDSAYLEPFSGASTAITATFKDLHELIRSPDQQHRLDALEPLVTARLAMVRASS